MKKYCEGLIGGSCNSNPQLQLLPGIEFVKNILTLISRPKNASTYSQSWLPDCTYWKFQTGYAANISLIDISLKDLRRSWHNDAAAIFEHHGPPLKIPLRLLLRPFFCKKFWALPMSVKAFTPWWRVMQDCIGNKEK